MFRTSFIAFAFFGCAWPAFALERGDLVGDWQTQWANAAGQAPEGGGPMRVTADSSEDSLDGVTPAPGWDGVMNGEVETSADGALVWSGHWASIWREGTTTGTFRFVFKDSNSFTGTWSSDDGVVAGAAWNGQRAR